MGKTSIYADLESLSASEIDACVESMNGFITTLGTIQSTLKESWQSGDVARFDAKVDEIVKLMEKASEDMGSCSSAVTTANSTYAAIIQKYS